MLASFVPHFNGFLTALAKKSFPQSIWLHCLYDLFCRLRRKHSGGLVATIHAGLWWNALLQFLLTVLHLGGIAAIKNTSLSLPSANHAVWSHSLLFRGLRASPLHCCEFILFLCPSCSMCPRGDEPRCGKAWKHNGVIISFVRFLKQQ